MKGKKLGASVLTSVMLAGTIGFPALAAMPDNSVVIGEKAFPLSYANDESNLEQIIEAIKEAKNNGRKIYIKTRGIWYNNDEAQSKLEDTSVIPAVVYITAYGTVNYEAGEGEEVSEGFEIENKKKWTNLNVTPNSKKFLIIPTCYKNDQVTHPKVIYLENGWNGYKFWMAYTPYPNSDDYYENPSIVVSNDMINWKDPFSINPLDFIEEDGDTHFSDTHLVYRKDISSMECWYRFRNKKTREEKFYRRITKDGKNWSEPEVTFNCSDFKEITLALSPAIIYEEKKYKMWLVNQEKKILYLESEDCNSWKIKKDIIIDFKFSEKYTPWHIDVIHTEKGYEMIISALYDGQFKKMNLYYTKSYDETHFEEAKLIMEPSKKQEDWDNDILYRSSFIIYEQEYYLFYSARSKNNEWHIGLSNGQDVFQLQGNKD